MPGICRLRHFFLFPTVQHPERWLKKKKVLAQSGSCAVIFTMPRVLPHAENHRHQVCPSSDQPRRSARLALQAFRSCTDAVPGFPSAPLAPWCFPKGPQSRAFLGRDSGSSGMADTSWRGSLGLTGICSPGTSLCWALTLGRTPSTEASHTPGPLAFILAPILQCRWYCCCLSLVCAGSS